MKLNIQSVKFNADDRLLEFIRHKIDKLQHFIDRIDRVDVILKLDKDHEKGNKLATIRIDVPGGELVVEQRHRTFEESIDEGIEALKRKIERLKNK